MNSNLFSAYSACGFARVLIVSETENDFHLIQPKPSIDSWKIISTRCVERGSGSSRAGTLRCSKGIRYRRRRNALEMFLNTLS